MANKDWWEDMAPLDCLKTGSWDDMTNYIQHSACTDFTIYSECTDTNPVFKFGGNNDIEFDGDRAIMIDDDETYIGHGAGDGITSGINNTLIGHDTGNSLTTEDACVMLGYEAGANATAANRLYINNSNSAFPLIYGEFDNDIVKFGDNSANWFCSVSKNGGVTELSGGDTAGDILLLSGSSVGLPGNSQSRIILYDNGQIVLDCNAASQIRFYEGNNEFMRFYESGTDDTIEGITTDNDLFLDPNGTGVVKFGTEVVNAGSDRGKLIKIKTAAGDIVYLKTYDLV